MALSDESKRRFQSIKAKAEEVMAIMGIGSMEEAYQLLAAESSQRAAEVAEKIDQRQKRQAQAELRAESARYNTLKGYTADSD
jgi:LPS sulfotransferase NodH